MGASRGCNRFKIFKLARFCAIFAAALFANCDARTIVHMKQISFQKTQKMHLKLLEMAKSLNMLMDASPKDSSSPSVTSPIILASYDSLAPNPLPDNNSPPYCIYPQPPSSVVTGPIVYSPTPPILSGSTPIPFSPVPISPYLQPSPAIYNPTPTSSPPPILGGLTPSPFIPSLVPPYYEPSPPSQSIPDPPEYVPPPAQNTPSPPVFEPPVVYPPPALAPPMLSTEIHGPGVWCVAKPSVPDPIIQEAMNYACGSGADCDPIQPNGQCFMPSTLIAHASYAFNSYWQRTKVAGGTCSFGGTAILVTVDPSSQECHFSNY